MSETQRHMARTGGNILGTRHRVKQKKGQEASPTQVTVMERSGEVRNNIELESEDDELDFIRGKFPVKYRKIEEADKPNDYPFHNVKWKKVKDETDLEGVPAHHVTTVERQLYVATQIPVLYDGLMPNDTVVGVLGGSGDRWNAACFRQGQRIGATVFRVPSFVLAKNREINDKNKDGYNLAKLFLLHPDFFYEVDVWDRAVIEVGELLGSRKRAMQNRIAISQQIRSGLIGMLFTSEEDLYPEGTIEDMYLAERANDSVYNDAVAEEERREKRLIEAVKNLDLWERIFASVEGWGPLQAAKIIADVGDIRRFATAAKFRAYCGVHVRLFDDHGKPLHRRLQFPRRRNKSKVLSGVANWDGTLRQALFLLADQANKRKDSDWGKKLREDKANYAERHPEEELPAVDTVTGEDKIDLKTGEVIKVKCFTKVHVHRTGLWKTATKIANRVYAEWWKIVREREEAKKGVPERS